MKSSNNTSKENENAKPNPIMENIKSRYILSKIYHNMTIKKKLVIIKYNKRIQNRLNLDVKDYKEYCEIEIEIISAKDKYGGFINIDKFTIFIFFRYYFYFYFAVFFIIFGT